MGTMVVVSGYPRTAARAVVQSSAGDGSGIGGVCGLSSHRAGMFHSSGRLHSALVRIRTNTAGISRPHPDCGPGSAAGAGCESHFSHPAAEFVGRSTAGSGRSCSHQNSANHRSSAAPSGGGSRSGGRREFCMTMTQPGRVPQPGDLIQVQRGRLKTATAVGRLCLRFLC